MIDSLLRLTYTATDASAATTAARAVLGSAEVTMRGAEMAWKQASIVDDGISVSRIQIAGDAVHLGIARATELLVVHVREGRVQLRNGDFDAELGAGGLGLVPIDANAQLRTNRADIEVFSFPPAPLARLLGVPKHRVQLHAPRIEPRSPELAEYFRRAAHLLTADVFGVPEVYDRDLVRTHAIDLLSAVTVEAFELTNRSEDAEDRDAAVLRRALAELRAHLADPISIPEVAATAGVSVRGLQMVFRRQLGVSPLLHLRALRLEAARQALQDEAASGTTVAEVARRFGYSNGGRFSTHYRDEFGESPAESLQRIRRSGATASPTSEAGVVGHASEPEDAPRR
ncbi:helix-turn-helix domain-containing protein [Amnibacterium setariae]|uniref:AraC family transcriptional regulator n=1 Tax=Amnibacterium setariae TaxID=2306585 RepID=A0A3A1U5A4_9MICO|nr:AraC family transcriptional regulator [Amnibacterium setariae]RIX30208.1 AraC family transcriptional regulator [Amnibacterium setariae]